jgi:hypothetical protein
MLSKWFLLQVMWKTSPKLYDKYIYLWMGFLMKKLYNLYVQIIITLLCRFLQCKLHNMAVFQILNCAYICALISDERYKYKSLKSMLNFSLIKFLQFSYVCRNWHVHPLMSANINFWFGITFLWPFLDFLQMDILRHFL